MTQPLLPSTIGSHPRHVTFLTTQKKNQENNGRTESPCLDKPVLAQEGEGGRKIKKRIGENPKENHFLQQQSQYQAQCRQADLWYVRYKLQCDDAS